MATKIAENLKKYRLKMNLTQEEVATAVKKTRSAYSQYETGRIEPDLETLVLLSKVLQRPTDILLGIMKESEEWEKAIPGIVLGQKMGDTINRKRISRKLKKQQKEETKKQQESQ